MDIQPTHKHTHARTRAGVRHADAGLMAAAGALLAAAPAVAEEALGEAAPAVDVVVAAPAPPAAAAASDSAFDTAVDSLISTVQVCVCVCGRESSFSCLRAASQLAVHIHVATQAYHSMHLVLCGCFALLSAITILPPPFQQASGAVIKSVDDAVLYALDTARKVPYKFHVVANKNQVLAFA